MAYGAGYLCGYSDDCDLLCPIYVVTYAGILMCVNNNQYIIGNPFITVLSNVIDNFCIPEC